MHVTKKLTYNVSWVLSTILAIAIGLATKSFAWGYIAWLGIGITLMTIGEAYVKSMPKKGGEHSAGGSFQSEKARVEPELKAAMQEQEREKVKQEIREITLLVRQTEGVIQEAIGYAKNAQNSLWLGELFLLQQRVYDRFQEFKAGMLPYGNAKTHFLDLKQQAEDLRNSPSETVDARQPKEKNYYEILSVDPKASLEEIKKMYRAKMQRLHPDKTASWTTEDVPQEVKEFLTETTRQLNLAYEVLSNPLKRREYDQRIAM